jgi:peroxiredoxin
MRSIVIGILVVTAVCGQSPARDPGPAVGSRAPDFTAVDQDGRPRSLHSLMGPKGLMLVFFRSADWWPYCKGQLVELQQNLEKTRRRGLGVAAISYDTVGVLRTFAQRKGISYPLLSDADSKVIRAYALLNETVPPGLPQFGIPFPGTFILDAFGLVVSKYFESDFRQRYTASDIWCGNTAKSPDQPASPSKPST